MKTRKFCAVVAALFTGTTMWALTNETGTAILKEIDSYSLLSGMDFSASLSMIKEDPAEGTNKTSVILFRNDDDDKFLLLIKEPEVKKGQGYLNIDDNLWFYDPGSRKFSHTTMNDQFDNSEANNSDFRSRSYSDDYTVASVEESMLGKYAVYILNLEAVNDEVTYPSEKFFVTVDGHLLLKSEDYSKSGRLMRSSYYQKYQKISDKYIATTMIFVDELIEGKKTTISMSDLSTKDLPDTVFTKAFVERVSN
jgi:outer membrane lipoprotein-sorting protein